MFLPAHLLKAVMSMGDQSDAAYLQRLQDFAREQSATYKTNLPMIYALSFAFLEWVEPLPLLCWLFAYTIAHTILTIICSNYLAKYGSDMPLPSPAEQLRYSTFFAIAIALTCGVWSLSLFFFWVPDSIENHAFLLATSAVALLPTLLRTRLVAAPFLASLITLSAAFLAAIAFHAFDPLLPVTIAYVVYVITLLVHIAQLNRKDSATYEFSWEKTRLIEALSKSKKESDAARLRAEEASLAKSQFLANMSHELRTPLNAIIGFSEVMDKQVFGPMTNDKYHQYSADIHASGLHLLALINDVLDLSKIEAGQYSIFEEVVDISIIADDCLRLISLRAGASHIHIERRFVSPLPELKADQRALRQIWLNLVTNAVKFSPAGSTVIMHADYMPDGSFYIGVEDQGPGIPEDEFETVLSSFGQGTEGKERPGSGTGLGLAIVRGLLEAHGGAFELESQVGSGTIVRATFPTRRIIDTPNRKGGLRRVSVAYP